MPEGEDDGFDENEIDAADILEEDLMIVESDDEEAVINAVLGARPSDSDDDEEDFIEDRKVVPERDDAVLTFSGHKGAVFCVVSSPDGQLVATGGEDDLALLWRLQDGQVLMCARGEHSDSVTRVAFNHDGSLFASADLNGLIQVWSVPSVAVAEAEVQVRCALEVGEEPWLTWHPAANVLLAGGSDGTAWLWQTAKHGTGSSKVLASASGAVAVDGYFLPCMKRAVVAYSDASVRVWQLRGDAPTVLHSLQLNTHPQLSVSEKEATPPAPVDQEAAAAPPVEDGVSGITCLACHKRLDLAAVATDVGHVVLMNTSRGAVTHIFSTLHLQADDFQGDARGIECLAFVATSNDMLATPPPPFLAAGTLDGWVLVFNYVALTLVHALRAVDCTQEDGQGGVSVIGLRWSVVGSQVHLYSADRQGKVKAWNALNGQLVATYQGHRDGLLDLDLVPRAAAAVPAVDQLLAAADSNDATVKLYRIPFHEPSTTASIS